MCCLRQVGQYYIRQRLFTESAEGGKLTEIIRRSDKLREKRSVFDTDGKQSVDKKAKIMCGANHCDPDDDF